MGLRLCVLLLIALAGAQSASVSQQHLNLGTVTSESLKDAKVCEGGNVCSYTSKTGIKMQDKANDAEGHTTKAQAKLGLDIDFDVESQCGSLTHELFRLVVRTVSTNGRDDTQAADAVTRFPCFFTQNRDTGIIEEFHASQLDTRSSRILKHGLVLALAKQLHPEAVAHLQKPGAETATYSFLGTDAAGSFKATHTLRRKTGGKAGLVLVEDKFYPTDEEKSSNEYVYEGQEMSISQKSHSEVQLGTLGDVEDIDEFDTLQLGSSQEPEHAPVEEIPSTGKTKFDAHVHATLIASTPSLQKCKATPGSDFETDMQTALSHSVVSKSLRAPLSHSEAVTAAAEEHEQQFNAASALSSASQVLAGQQFDLQDLTPHVHEQTAEEIAKRSWDLYKLNQLDTVGLQKVLAALGAKRSAPTYKELTRVLADKDIPVVLRQQAAVSLIHLEGEDEAPPAQVVADVAAVAARGPSDPLWDEATLLQATLLSTRPHSDQTRRQLVTWVNKLAIADPDNQETAAHTVTLLGALANLGAPQAASIAERFMTSKVAEVKTAASHLMSQVLSHQASLDLEDAPSEHMWMPEGSEPMVDLDTAAAGNKAELVSKKWNLAGSKDFDLGAYSKVGVKWGGSAEVEGSSGLNLRIWNDNRPLLEVGFSASLSPDGGDLGTKGSAAAYISIRGKKVSSNNFKFQKEDLHVGGECPATFEAARGSTRHNGNMFFRNLATFQPKSSFVVGPVPVSVKVEVGGGVGYRVIYGAYLNCQSAGSKEDIAFVAGLESVGDISARVQSSVDIPQATASVKGDLIMLKGKMPSYAIATKGRACASLDANLQSMGGDVSLNAHVDGKDYTRPLVQIRSAPKKLTLFKKCAVIEFGEFITGRKGSQTDIASRTRKLVENDQARAAANKDAVKAEAIASGRIEKFGRDQLRHNVAQAENKADEEHAKTTTGVINGANSAAAAEGDKDRDQARSAASAQSGETRANGARTRDTSRSASQRTQAAAVSEGRKERSTARNAGRAVRGVARRAGRRVAKGFGQVASGLRKLTRRAEERVEAKEVRNRKSEGSAVSRVQAELKQFEEQHAQQSLKDLMRREDKKADDREKSLEHKLDNRAKRAEVQRFKDKQSKSMGSIKKMLERRSEHEKEDRTFKRIEKADARRFKELEEKDEFRREKRVERRNAKLEDNERRGMEKIRNKIRRDDEDKKQRRYARREAKDVERVASTAKQNVKQLDAIEQDVRKGVRADRRANRRAARAVKETQRRERKEELTRNAAARARKVARRQVQAKSVRKENRRLEKEVRKGEAKAVDTSRREEKRIKKTVRASATKAARESQQRRSRRTFRRGAKAAKQASRRAAKTMAKSIAAGAQDIKAARRASKLKEEVAQDAKRSRRRARQTKKTIRRAARRARKAGKRAAKRETRERRETAKRLKEAARRKQEDMKDTLARVAAATQAATDRELRRTEQQVEENKAVATFQKHNKVLEDRLRKRLERVDKRSDAKAQRMNARFNKRASRMESLSKKTAETGFFGGTGEATMDGSSPPPPNDAEKQKTMLSAGVPAFVKEVEKEQNGGGDDEEVVELEEPQHPLEDEAEDEEDEVPELEHEDSDDEALLQEDPEHEEYKQEYENLD